MIIEKKAHSSLQAKYLVFSRINVWLIKSNKFIFYKMMRLRTNYSAAYDETQQTESPIFLCSLFHFWLLFCRVSKKKKTNEMVPFPLMFDRFFHFQWVYDYTNNLCKELAENCGLNRVYEKKNKNFNGPFSHIMFDGFLIGSIGLGLDDMSLAWWPAVVQLLE